MRSEDRLKEWKAFRSEIGTLPFDEALLKTVHLWSFAPFVNHHLDHYAPTDWPGPWDLLVENKYDDLAKALGMLYTLYLSKHGTEHSYSIVKAQVGSSLEGYNLVLVDEGKYVLNYAFNEVISNQQLGTEVEFIQTYTESDLQLDKL
jgi:hypothetical protein